MIIVINLLGLIILTISKKRGVEVRAYPIVCPSCRGLGTIDNPESVSSSAKITCPACKGNKTVIVSDDGNI